MGFARKRQTQKKKYTHATPTQKKKRKDEMQSRLDAFVVRGKRKAPESPTVPIETAVTAARRPPKGDVASKRPRDVKCVDQAPTDDTATRTTLWSEGVRAGTAWSYIVDALICNVPLSRIVRVIKTLGALASVSRLLYEVLHLKRIRIDVLAVISQEGRVKPRKTITVMCMARPLALAGVRRKLRFDLFSRTSYEGVSLMIAHDPYSRERHWYRARSGLLCGRSVDALAERAESDDDADDRGDDQGRLPWPRCERMIKMPLSYIMWGEIRWTNKAPWKDADDDGDNNAEAGASASDQKQECDDQPNGDAHNEHDGNDQEEGDHDDHDDDEEDRHHDEFGKWLTLADGRWSMCVFHDYRWRMSLYRVSIGI
nr:hypothetical protein [Pandoravirus massiliensis]